MRYPFDFILIHGYVLTPQGEMQPLLQQRLTDGFDLYAHGAAPHLIVTGKHGEQDKDFVLRTGTTEADLMKAYLVQQGISPADVFTEREGTTTWACTYNAMDKIVKPSSWYRGGMIVTNQEHIGRIAIQTMKVLAQTGLKRIPIGFYGSPILDEAQCKEFWAHERKSLLEHTLARDD